MSDKVRAAAQSLEHDLQDHSMDAEQEEMSDNGYRSRSSSTDSMKDRKNRREKESRGKRRSRDRDRDRNRSLERGSDVEREQSRERERERYYDRDCNRTHGRSNKKFPPARHLYVGNAEGLNEHDLRLVASSSCCFLADPNLLLLLLFFRKAFGTFGKLESVEMGPNKMYGFVNFFTEEDATNAKRQLQVG